MSDSAGYTLSEMLVALLILGLTAGGVMQASALIGRLQSNTQKHVAGFQSGRRVQMALSDLFEGRGPFGSTTPHLEGDAQGLRFACGDAQCSARLQDDGGKLSIAGPSRSEVALGTADGAHFEYVGTATTGEVWPPAGRVVQQLAAIRLMGGARGQTPIASAQVWRQEAPGCQFDVIAKACRGGEP